MEQNPKLDIYKGMIQYILETTHYTLKHIAQLSQSSLENIRLIYCQDHVSINFKTEVELIKLYQIILEINIHKESRSLSG